MIFEEIVGHIQQRRNQCRRNPILKDRKIESKSNQNVK